LACFVYFSIINLDSTAVVPTLGSRTAKERNGTGVVM